MREHDFRNYVDSERHDLVTETYRLNHVNMTFDHVIDMHEKWLDKSHKEHTIEEAIALIDTIVDDSDPDVSLPNSVHAFQTAESLRTAYPNHDWLHLVGLLHDLGKVMCCWGEPQWNVVGDTYPMGCKFSSNIVLSELFKDNPDTMCDAYSTENGVYAPRCGLDALTMSWGHDEYMYGILVKNRCSIPLHGLSIIRYHSFYAWHTEGAYTHFTNLHDRAVKLLWIRAFNTHDLYTKTSKVYDATERKRLWDSYYHDLCIKYNVGGKLQW